MSAHRAAFEYDWRARFHLPLSVVGTPDMSYGEAGRLAAILMADPSSQVAAAREGWDAPRSREWFVMVDLFDLTHRSLSKNPKPYPRPNAPAESGMRRGRTTLSREAVVAILNAHGHSFPGGE